MQRNREVWPIHRERIECVPEEAQMLIYQTGTLNELF